MCGRVLKRMYEHEGGRQRNCVCQTKCAKCEKCVYFVCVSVSVRESKACSVGMLTAAASSNV